MLKRAQPVQNLPGEVHPSIRNHRWCCPEHGAEFAMQELEKKRENRPSERKKESAQPGASAKPQ
jgi:hypothetical protein